MRISNWFRKKLNRPVKFDLDKALAEAQAEAHAELERIAHPAILAKVESWEHVPDPFTDGLDCGEAD